LAKAADTQVVAPEFKASDELLHSEQTIVVAVSVEENFLHLASVLHLASDVTP